MKTLSVTLVGTYDGSPYSPNSSPGRTSSAVKLSALVDPHTAPLTPHKYVRDKNRPGTRLPRRLKGSEGSIRSSGEVAQA